MSSVHRWAKRLPSVPKVADGFMSFRPVDRWHTRNGALALSHAVPEAPDQLAARASPLRKFNTSRLNSFFISKEKQ